ncbi:MAG TPA: NlpC/P60 family protein [Thermomicrobiales bacterium]|nr:NlpC/P60 family protein [Thermomicrobiales bacterium]
MLTLPMRKRLVGLLMPAIVMLVIAVAPFAAPASVSADGTDAMATEQVYVRSGPSTADAILGELFNGDWVTLTGYSENGFYEVWYGDYVAYVYADYLAVGGAVEQPAAAAAESGPTGTWYTNDAVNLRSGAGTDNGVVSVLPAGAEVYLTGNVANGFTEVDSGYGWGWIATQYLSGSAPAAAVQETSAGQSLVNFAMQYQGYPYVWAGNTPSGFDCSGFTQYVVQNVLGYDITHSTDIQATHGSPVAWGEWQPGDLVFFVGTGGGGYISHVGIYIGDGQMIHAENPGTGVVVSSLYSDYYSSHYYSATRLA